MFEDLPALVIVKIAEKTLDVCSIIRLLSVNKSTHNILDPLNLTKHLSQNTPPHSRLPPRTDSAIVPAKEVPSYLAHSCTCFGR